MKMQVRLLFLAAALALTAGWLGLRAANQELAAQVGGAS
jgi:hypothetical protein